MTYIEIYNVKCDILQTQDDDCRNTGFRPTEMLLIASRIVGFGLLKLELCIPERDRIFEEHRTQQLKSANVSCFKMYW